MSDKSKGFLIVGDGDWRYVYVWYMVATGSGERGGDGDGAGGDDAGDGAGWWRSVGAGTSRNRDRMVVERRANRLGGWNDDVRVTGEGVGRVYRYVVGSNNRIMEYRGESVNIIDKECASKKERERAKVYLSSWLDTLDPSRVERKQWGVFCWSGDWFGLVSCSYSTTRAGKRISPDRLYYSILYLTQLQYSTMIYI